MRISKTNPVVSIPFIDLQAQRQRIGARIDAAIARVLTGGQFILGPEVAELERQLADFAGVRHCVSCANGTDALVLVLMAEGIGRGDAVFVPAFTFVATAEAVRLTGATPVFCDVSDDSFNLDPESLAAAVPYAAGLGLAPRAVIPVDLFGQAADYHRLAPIAERHRLAVFADAAQSFGAARDNRRVGGFGKATTTSFFPAKPLGCYGDGGAILTDDQDFATLLRSLRMHGQGRDRYENVRVGLNSRLDTLQAAILIEKLAIFEDELAARQRVAERYAEGLRGAPGVRTPALAPGARSAWAQYTLRLPERDAVAERLKREGVPTAIYYPIPLSAQEGYRGDPVAPGGTPVSARLSGEVLSLPMHPYLDEATQDRIIALLRA